jgi:hypothetical protein
MDVTNSMRSVFGSHKLGLQIEISQLELKKYSLKNNLICQHSNN